MPGYAALFEGRSLSEQFAIQAAGERAGGGLLRSYEMPDAAALEDENCARPRRDLPDPFRLISRSRARSEVISVSLCQAQAMRVVIEGFDLPGAEICDPDGAVFDGVHVGVQVGREPVDLVSGAAAALRWELDVDVVRKDGGELDFKGPAVHGSAANGSCTSRGGGSTTTRSTCSGAPSSC